VLLITSWGRHLIAKNDPGREAREIGASADMNSPRMRASEGLAEPMADGVQVFE
jgi:hypothetical protein